MITNIYYPQPADLTDISLPQELLNLAESLARNVHEVWAANRIAEGWTYGPVRDADKMETPCLVPYADLPEIEKAYDRNTAIGTLKYIVANGFEITKKA